MLSGSLRGMRAQKKPVEKRAKGFVVRQTVAGTHKHERLKRARFPSPAENTLVESHQQAVQQCAVRVEQLIKEDKAGFRKHSFRVGDQVPFPQTADVEGTEKLGRLREPGQEIIKSPALQSGRE